MAPSGDLVGGTAAVRAFADEREQGQFHTPRKLILAMVGEVGELAEVLQWLPDEDVQAALTTDRLRGRFEEEIADVVIYLLRLADVTGVDLEAAVAAKLAVNEARYPIEISRGRDDRYDER
jgi:dCTP diphosphatase